jgi:hypothetical protein
VRKVYYEDNDIDRIITYCEKDTIAVAQVFLRLRNENIQLLAEKDKVILLLENDLNEHKSQL